MIEVAGLHKYFSLKPGLLDTLGLHRADTPLVKAVNGISFSMRKGEIFGLAGESGCGKTTTGMLLLRLYPPTSGTILFDGQEITGLRGNALVVYRRQAQMIFQDPYESLNPRFTVRRTIEEPLIIHRLGNAGKRHEQIVRTMERVRLMPVEAFLDKYPHELSGGERQRVSIARAVVLNPMLLVADEAVSMLDVSIRASILNLLRDLTEELQMATLYISHDLSLLGSICGRIAIMYAGEIVEAGTPRQVLLSPFHPYTRALISAAPVPEFHRGRRGLTGVSGDPPDLMNLPIGCFFQPRCPSALERCLEERPRLHDRGDEHLVACHGKG